MLPTSCSKGVLSRIASERSPMPSEETMAHFHHLPFFRAILEHLEQMKKFPDMEHDEPNKVTLQPGKQGTIVWQFTRAGVVNFACLMPGHFEAGMKGAVKVGRK